jgi:hypothetical protein
MILTLTAIKQNKIQSKKPQSVLITKEAILVFMAFEVAKTSIIIQ